MSIAGMLGQVSSLRRTQRKHALLSGENFNVFRILGLESREVRTHSAFLGELLNPAGSHGLKDTFLRLFTEAIQFPEFDTTAAHLVVEYDLGRITADYQQGGRIDIYLESAGEYIFIENKIYAGDQPNQLARYLAHRKKARLLYLTLEGSVASDWSSGGLTADQYQVLSYKKDVAAWLEKCRQAASAYPLVRETIVQYQHLINHLTGNTPNDFMQEEMKHLLQSSQDNFVSAGALVQAYEETRQGFYYFLKDTFEQEWRSRFEQNLSPVPDFAVYFRPHNNSYGFRAEKSGVEVSANSEEALRPLIALALAIPKFKRDNNWLGWKWMDSRYFDNLPPEELYLAATNEEARARLFEERMREVVPYFEQFKEMAEKLKAAE
jgi:hypothetical protein